MKALPKSVDQAGLTKDHIMFRINQAEAEGYSQAWVGACEEVANKLFGE